MNTNIVNGVSAARVFGQSYKYAPRITLDAPNDAGADTSEADKEVTTAEEKTEAEQKDAGTLSDREAQLLKEVMEKKTKLRQAEETAAAAAKQLDDVKNRLKAFEGIDPVEVKKMIEEKKNAEKASLEAKGDFERLKAMMVEEHKREVEAARLEIQAKAAELQKASNVINDLTIGAAFSGSIFVADELTLTPAKARIIYGDHFDVEDGKVVAYDKPRGAEGRTKLVNGNGESIGFEDAIKKLVDMDPDKDRLVKSKLKEGAGSKTTDAKVKEKQPDVKGRDRIAFALTQLTANK